MSDDQGGPVILDPSGKPARKPTAADDTCPHCGAGPDTRGPSCGFGTPKPVCGRCGYTWHNEVWHG